MKWQFHTSLEVMEVIGSPYRNKTCSTIPVQDYRCIAYRITHAAHICIGLQRQCAISEFWPTHLTSRCFMRVATQCMVKQHVHLAFPHKNVRVIDKSICSKLSTSQRYDRHAQIYFVHFIPYQHKFMFIIRIWLHGSPIPVCLPFNFGNYSYFPFW